LPLTGEIASVQGQASLNDKEFAAKVLATERELEQLPGVKSVLSIFDLASGISEMMTGQPGYPENPMVIQGVVSQLGEDGRKAWISDDGFRMLIRTQDLATHEIAELEAFVRENSDVVRIITGMPVLFDEMNNLVVESQVRSLGLAIILVFLMLLIALRKFGAALIGLLPIVLTIAAIMGMLAITGFHLNILTANLSAISVGVGVDYSIHLISGIYHFRKQGMSNEESVSLALKSVSRPILANAFGLSIGFSVLFFSPLAIHIQAASVMWIAMMVSSMAALLLIPMLYSYRRRSRKPAK
jgi:predicted RND superfamily exporter protein